MIFKKNNSFIKKNSFKEISYFIIIAIIFNFSTLATIPVLDRDEARYVQASRQMIETNNFSTIKFQEEYRSKKPLGIYWLQSFFVNQTSNVYKATKEQLNVRNDPIWKYRIISSITSLASIIILFYLAKKIFSRKIAFFSAIILSISLLFVIESHIAKTDAALLTCTVPVLLILLGYYLRIFNKSSSLAFYTLWFFLSASILIKGPVLLFMSIISSVFIIIIKKDFEWIKNTSPLKGCLIVILLVIPSTFLLLSSGQDNFLEESIKNDFIKKILSAQEKHSAFFGAHFLSTWFLFFPMSILLVPTFIFAKKNFLDNKIFFLLSWIIPNLIILELIPTKLPHYSLPLYPALSILVAIMLLKSQNKSNLFDNYLSIIGYSIYFLTSSMIILGLTFCTYKFGNINNYIIFLSIILLILNTFSIFIVLKKKFDFLINYQVFYSAALYLSIFLVFLPNMKHIWVSRNILETLKNSNYQIDSKDVYSIGYNEPSLVFEIGTHLNIMKNLENLNSKNIKFLILEQKYYEKFIEIVQNNAIKYILLDEIRGFNSAKSKWVRIYVFKILN